MDTRTSNNRRKQFPYLQDLMAVLFFLFLTITISWPVLSQLNSVIVGDDNDVYINPWADWWTLKALQEPDIEFWHTDYLFYPHGVSLTYHSFSHLNTLVSLSLRPLIGILPAYNLAILLNYVLAGMAMFQLARYTTKSAMAGIIAGIVFSFNSHNLYQSAHPVLVSIWCFPWITLYFMKAVREDRIKFAIVTAVFIFLGAATSTLLLILMGIWLIILTIYFMMTEDWPKPSWKILLTTGILSAFLILPLIFPLLNDAFTNNNSSYLTDPEGSIVTDIASPFVPYWLKGPTIGWLYFGIVPFFLLLVACKYSHKKVRLWFWLLLGGYFFAIGPRPEFFGNKLNFTLPWSLALAPVLRNLYRVNILISLGLAMLAAYGWTVLASRLKRKNLRQLTAGIVAVLIFGEYAAVSFPHTPLQVSPFFTEFLEEIPKEAALAILPTGRQEDKKYLYYQTLHKHKITGGHVSRPSDNTFNFINNNALLNAGSVDLDMTPKELMNQNIEIITHELHELADRKVHYLILHKEFIHEGYLQIWRDWLTFSPVYEDDQVIVFHTSPHLGRDFELTHQLSENIGLIRTNFVPVKAIQSGVIKVDVRWAGIAEPEFDHDACFQLVNAAGVVSQTNCQPISPSWPTSQWQANEIVRGFYKVSVGNSLEPGPYQLTLTLEDRLTGKMVGKSAVLGQIFVQSFQPTHHTEIHWNDLIYLTGYDLQQSVDSLDLSLYWRANQKTEKSYKVFIHLINPLTGQPIAQSDAIPRNWTYPTNIWEIDEIVKDSISLPLPELQSGQYELWLGLYDEINGERLPIAAAGNLEENDGAVQLTTVGEQFTR